MKIPQSAIEPFGFIGFPTVYTVGTDILEIINHEYLYNVRERIKNAFERNPNQLTNVLQTILFDILRFDGVTGPVFTITRNEKYWLSFDAHGKHYSQLIYVGKSCTT